MRGQEAASRVGPAPALAPGSRNLQEVVQRTEQDLKTQIMRALTQMMPQVMNIILETMTTEANININNDNTLNRTKSILFNYSDVKPWKD